MAWVEVADRLPDFGRWVKVWGNHCEDGYTAPMAYRRRETPGRPFWFWSSPEWRGTAGVFWWWDDAGEVVKNVAPPDRPFRPIMGPGDAPSGMPEAEVSARYEAAGLCDEGDGG